MTALDVLKKLADGYTLRAYRGLDAELVRASENYAAWTAVPDRLLQELLNQDWIRRRSWERGHVIYEMTEAGSEALQEEAA